MPCDFLSFGFVGFGVTNFLVEEKHWSKCIKTFCS